MPQRPLLAAVLVACVTAAGAGGYVATRHMSRGEAPAPVAADVVGGEASDEMAEGAPGSSEEALGTEGQLEAPVPGQVEPPDPEVSTGPGAVAQPNASRPAPSVPTSPAPRPAAAPEAPAPLPRAWPRPPAPPSTEDLQSPPREEATNARNDTGPTRDPGPSQDASPPRRDDAPPERQPGSSRRYGNSADGSIPARPPAGPEPTRDPLPVRRSERVTIPADSVIGLQLEDTISTATARVEDPVRARVSRDVMAAGTVVVPAGSRLLGSVTLVEEGGKFRNRARLGVRFHTLVLADGAEVRLPSETIYRDGESPAGRSAAKIGGAAVGGAILGAVIGGGRGAAIGAAAGAGSGTAMTAAGERRPAELRAGEAVTVRVSDEVTTEIER